MLSFAESDICAARIVKVGHHFSCLSLVYIHVDVQKWGFKRIVLIEWLQACILL